MVHTSSPHRHTKDVQHSEAEQRRLVLSTLHLARKPQSNMRPRTKKIIKMLIYGVKSSGNQAEHPIRETAKLSKDKFPDVYVDDGLSGEKSSLYAT